MSNWDYHSYISTNDKKLIKKLKGAIFHFKNPSPNAVFDWQKEYEAIDLAVLFGLRKTHYKQKGDTPLTREEAIKLCEIFDGSNAKYSLGSQVKGVLKTIRGTLWEQEYRIQRADWTMTEDGRLQIDGGPDIDLGFCITITKMLPGTVMEVEQYLDYDDDGYCWSREYTKYSVRCGSAEETDHNYEKGYYEEDEDQDSSCNSNENQQPSKEEECSENDLLAGEEDWEEYEDFFDNKGN